MITHNSHNIKIHFNSTKTLLLWGVLVLFYTISNAQDSIVAPAFEEEKLVEFQEFFFKAITEKAKENYQAAIENLEECNSLLPNNDAVLFELSKNYYEQDKTTEAIDYAKQALVLKPNNLWLLEHLVATYKKSRNFKEAIAVQTSIAEHYPKKKRALVYLHLQNSNPKKARQVLNELAEAKLLNNRLRQIQKNLNKRKTSKAPTVNTSGNSLELQFEKEKSFKVLTTLLNKLASENNPKLLDYSEKGMLLFPAQPLVYLMNGKALNNNKSYKKAITSLQSGIDFVIDDAQMEQRFYQELIKAYTGLGDTKNANKYKNKLK